LIFSKGGNDFATLWG